MRDRQISIRRVAEELPIIHGFMNNHMGMKKVCIWGGGVPKLLTPIQRTNHGCFHAGPPKFTSTFCRHDLNMLVL